jgi:hypothetical protein
MLERFDIGAWMLKLLYIIMECGVAREAEAIGVEVRHTTPAQPESVERPEKPVAHAQQLSGESRNPER